MNEVYTLEKLFESFPGGICVPRIQRGYVQGREDAKGGEIRANFVPALVSAVFDKKPLSLDFVYGVADGRCLMPLDGQQRLTTLFLLAWLCGKWNRSWGFSYESRRIPKMFAEGLVKHPYAATDKPSAEIINAAWYLPIWKEDPTVAGMLSMLDAIYNAIGFDRKIDSVGQWVKLKMLDNPHDVIGSRNRTEADFSQITFLLHGINGSCKTFDHIFRKMNARGKELSPWENMKAMLDKHLDKGLPKDMAEVWRDKIDGDWAEYIWKRVGKDIGKLDNAMEKIIRMAYARVAGFDKQEETLWQIDSKLSFESEEAFSETDISNFFQFATTCFNALEQIANWWTADRTKNTLWGNAADKADSTAATAGFWKWLSNGNNASISDILRISFLTEEPHCADSLRRRRILLNLLDASSISNDKFIAALDVGCSFLNGSLDLISPENRQVAYSLEQIEDEIRKWLIDEKDIIKFEKDELVQNGSLCFIGWAKFRDADDICKRMALVRSAISGARWLDFYQDLISRIPTKSFDGRYLYVPLRANDIDVWKDHILNDRRFIEALKIWHESPDAHLELPAWMDHLSDLLYSGKVVSSTLRCWDGWMFLLQTDRYRSTNSIRLDRNKNERGNRWLLKAGEVFYASPWPWAEAKEEGVFYNINDSSWRESNKPSKGTRGSDGNIDFVTYSPLVNK